MQGLHVVPEALGLLDFCQVLIHLPAAADLGVVGTDQSPGSHLLTGMAEVGRGRQPHESLGPSGMLFKADVINRIHVQDRACQCLFHLYIIGLQCFK